METLKYIYIYSHVLVWDLVVWWINTLCWWTLLTWCCCFSDNVIYIYIIYDMIWTNVVDGFILFNMFIRMCQLIKHIISILARRVIPPSEKIQHRNGPKYVGFSFKTRASEGVLNIRWKGWKEKVEWFNQPSGIRRIRTLKKTQRWGPTHYHLKATR